MFAVLDMWACFFFFFSVSCKNSKDIYTNMRPKELIQSAVEKDRNWLSPEADSYWFVFQRTTIVIATEGPRTWCVFRHILWTFKIEAFHWDLYRGCLFLYLWFLICNFCQCISKETENALITIIIDDTFVQVAPYLNKTLWFLIKGTDYTLKGRIAL